MRLTSTLASTLAKTRSSLLISGRSLCLFSHRRRSSLLFYRSGLGGSHRTAATSGITATAVGRAATTIATSKPRKQTGTTSRLCLSSNYTRQSQSARQKSKLFHKTLSLSAHSVCKDIIPRSVLNINYNYFFVVTNCTKTLFVRFALGFLSTFSNNSLPFGVVSLFQRN